MGKKGLLNLSMEILAHRLNTLQTILTEFALESGFSLLSPFADRHGFPEAEFIRPMGSVTKSISVAVDPRNDIGWICEFRAGASVPVPLDSFESNSSSVVLAERPIFRPNATLAQNKSAFVCVFKLAVAAAHTAYDVVSEQAPQLNHAVSGTQVHSQFGAGVALKAASKTAASSLLAKAR
jgi:hypothetical protein